MPYFDGSSGPVYYRHWSNPAPRAGLVFLHGFGEHSGLYHRYAAELGAHGIDLWALDEIGHGLTAGVRGQFGSFADLVANAQTLTAIARLAKPDLALAIGGHSLGSLVALLAALDSPDAYVAAVVSGAPLSPLAWLSEAVATPGATVDLDPTELSSDPFYLDQLENDPLAFTSGDVVEPLAAAFPTAWQRFDAELPGLKPPLLAVQGRNDQIAPLGGVTSWQDRLPELRLEVIADAAHDILNEVAHTEVANIIAAFVLANSPAAVRVPA